MGMFSRTVKGSGQSAYQARKASGLRNQTARSAGKVQRLSPKQSVTKPRGK